MNQMVNNNNKKNNSSNSLVLGWCQQTKILQKSVLENYFLMICQIKLNVFPAPTFTSGLVCSRKSFRRRSCDPSADTDTATGLGRTARRARPPTSKNVSPTWPSLSSFDRCFLFYILLFSCQLFIWPLLPLNPINTWRSPLYFWHEGIWY